MIMRSLPAVAASLAVLLLVQTAHGCVHMMHATPRRLQEGKGDKFDYDFRGDDWVGKDATGKDWVCTTGKQQSPIAIAPSTSVPTTPLLTLKTSWSYDPLQSDGNNVQIYNNGYNVQVQWTEGALSSLVKVPTKNNILDYAISDILTGFKYVTATPIQCHWHIESEHTLDGTHLPLEMHCVHVIPKSQLESCPEDPGCLFVTGWTFKLDPQDRDNQALKPVFDHMPFVAGDVTDMPSGLTFDIEALMPRDRDYVYYAGSLTTPPCAEGLLWHVLTKPVYISKKQLKQYYLAVGPKSCDGASTAATLGRRLMSRTDMDAFVRGSYTGFRRVALEENKTVRNLLQDSTCKAEAYGVTWRNTQPLNGRKVYAVNA